MNKIKWEKRKFVFDLSIDIFPQIIERLRETPSKVSEITSHLSEEQRLFQIGQQMEH